MGGYLVWIALLALAASVSGRYRVRSALASLALFLAVFGVAMSLSWGAYADLLAVLSVASLQIRTLSRGSRLRLTRLGAALAVVLLVAGATPLRQALVGRLERLSRTPIDPAVSVPDPDSLRSRVINLRHTVLLFETAPVTGIGIGQFRVRTGAPPARTRNRRGAAGRRRRPCSARSARFSSRPGRSWFFDGRVECREEEVGTHVAGALEGPPAPTRCEARPVQGRRRIPGYGLPLAANPPRRARCRGVRTTEYSCSGSEAHSAWRMFTR